MQARAADPVLVVGGGVIGASIAFHLARRGRRVAIVDDGGRGGTVPASPGSFGWLNATTATDRGYHRVRRTALGHWRDLKDLHPDLPVRFPGSLMWEAEAAEIKAQAARFAAWDDPVRAISGAEVRSLEPKVSQVPELALFADDEGVAEPDLIAGWFRRQAAAHGAEYIGDCVVGGLACNDGRVTGVTTQGGEVRGSAVVIAAGCGSPPLLAEAGFTLPMDNRPGMIVRTNPLPPLLCHVIGTPSVHLWQGTDGRVRAGADYGGGFRSEDANENARIVVEEITRTLNYDGSVDAEQVLVTPRPQPADGYPVVGAVAEVEGLYLAVMHSGMTLAPLVGRALSMQIINGVVDPMMRPYGADRFIAPRSVTAA